MPHTLPWCSFWSSESTKNLAKSYLETTRPGDSSCKIRYSLDGSSAICGGKIAIKSNDDCLVMSNMRWCSAFKCSNAFGTLLWSHSKNDDKHTDIGRMFCFFMPSMMFWRPVDMTVVGSSLLRVPSATMTPSTPFNAFSTSGAFTTSPWTSSTRFLNASGTVVSLR